jgi:hypothetical protein
MRGVCNCGPCRARGDTADGDMTVLVNCPKELRAAGRFVIRNGGAERGAERVEVVGLGASPCCGAGV